jgi:hypothetical protein
MLYTDWWVTSLCEVVMVTHQTHQTFQTSPDVQTCPDVPRRAQKCPDVVRTWYKPRRTRRAQTCPRRPDVQTPRHLPDACQTPARRSQTQPDVPDASAQASTRRRGAVPRPARRWWRLALHRMLMPCQRPVPSVGCRQRHHECRCAACRGQPPPVGT